MDARFIVLIVAFVSLFEKCSSSGKLSLNFRRYENPGGKGDNGHCCDGRSFFCFGACDHRFLVCADDRYGSSNMGHCPYGRIQTGVVNDADTIVFYGSIGGTRNPLLFNFNRWPGSVKIKVYVEDHDDNSNDYVDFIQNVITVTPGRSESTAPSKIYVLSRRTRLTIVAKAYCDPNYFGPRCEDYCKPRDDHSGHYTCNTVTGRIICNPGWMGEFCASSHDDCVVNQCQNGATCLDSHQSYICICPDGITGQYCDDDIDECTNKDICKNNGVCINSFGSYSCNCSMAWKGPDCTEPVDFCTSSPCENGGECQSNESGYHCTCANGWTGSQCETNVDECLEEPCFNNGTCVDTDGSFQCLCINGTLGNLCEINIDDCASSPCNHSNATCHDVINGYHCTCPPGITGLNCTEELFQIEFPMTLNSEEEDIIKNAIEEILQENSEHLKDDMNLETSFGTFYSDNGVMTTIVSLMVFYKGKQLDQAYLRNILTTDKVENLRKLVHLHKEDALKLLQISDVDPVHESSVTQENWIVSNWYAIVIIVAVVIILVLIPVVTHVIRRRKRKVTEVDMTAYWQPNQEAPSLGFENIVYNVEQQPLHTNMPEDIESTTESIPEYTDIDIPDSSCIANNGGIGSFKHGKTDS